MDDSRYEQDSQDSSLLDKDEASWQEAVIGFIVIFAAVGLFFLFWVKLFELSAS